MVLITTLEQLLQNINNADKYLATGADKDKMAMRSLINRGTCFVAYSIDKEIRFAPSRFLGYAANNIYKHTTSKKDGRETNKAINKILGSDPVPNTELEKEYFIYCNNLGLAPSRNGAYGAPRKFWTLKLKNDFKHNEDLTGEFPEGKIVERMHKARERNSKVIQIAKENFKRRHGRLFCEVCEFDFETKYGQLGIDYIEGHHTLAVSAMTPDHKTKPEDIAMLCSNCHRMAHKRRPWLTITELSKLLAK